MNSNAASLRAQGVAKSFGSDSGRVDVIGGIDFELPPGSLTCIVGPSGCGKTTLMRILAGLAQPDAGAVFVDDKPMTGRPEQLAMVFQDYSRSLLPWMSVEDNITFPLKAQGVRAAARRDAAREALAAVSLEGFGDRYPWQLSGGMQQRVAIARALAYRPRILLMDEPFASLDAQVRGELEDLTRRLQRDTGVTVALVTHDIDEAVYLGDHVLVLTHRPTSVLERIDVPLAPERDQVTTRADPAFVTLRHHVAALIHQQRAGTAAR